MLVCPAGMLKRTGKSNIVCPTASKRTDHHEKLKLYTKICINLGIEKASQKQAEKKLVEYVEQHAEQPADAEYSKLLVEVTEYIKNCWRVQVSSLHT